MKIRKIKVHPNLPEALAPLKEIAMNVWYSWNWDAVHLFIRLNPAVWEESMQNPVLMLGMVSQQDLEKAANDDSYISSLTRVYDRFKEYMSGSGWYQ
ncbi:MAG TPA: DUF3417 domain-containing protein, partial [Myxococcota bacterium]|nr:DUF3417 domain-containing protein [Myxococcota bacterium]